MKVLEIINDAYRESNNIAAGIPVGGDQLSEGERLFNQVILSTFNTTLSSRLREWVVGPLPDGLYWPADRWTKPVSNARLLVNDTAVPQITLPVRGVADGARIAVARGQRDFAANPITLNAGPYRIGTADSAANTRVIDSGPDVGVLNWFFRADLGVWVEFGALTHVDELPFPGEFDSYFTTRLAKRLNPRYGRATADDTNEEFARAERALRARYFQKVVVRTDLDWRFNSVQAYNQFFYRGSGE